MANYPRQQRQQRQSFCARPAHGSQQSHGVGRLLFSTITTCSNPCSTARRACFLTHHVRTCSREPPYVPSCYLCQRPQSSQYLSRAMRAMALGTRARTKRVFRSSFSFTRPVFRMWVTIPLLGLGHGHTSLPHLRGVQSILPQPCSGTEVRG